MSSQIVKLAFVGDICPSGIYSVDDDVLSSALRELRASLDADCVLAFNLECSLNDQSDASDTEASSNSLRILSELKPAIANLSNNHHFDSGLEGSQKIVEMLEEIGIPTIGVYRDRSVKYEVLTVAGAKLGFVARTAYGTNPKSFGEPDRRMLPVEFDEIVESCKEMVAACDISIAALHWGAEYYRFSSPRQKRLASTLVKAGVDVIWGHHAHVLQSRDVQGKSLVLMNMGNTLFGQTELSRWPRASRRAAVVECEFSGITRSWWERRCSAALGGEPLNIGTRRALRVTHGRVASLWWSLQIALWVMYRAYMEIGVFGARFVVKALRRERQGAAVSRDVEQSPVSTHGAGGLFTTLQERIRRVTDIWTDE